MTFLQTSTSVALQGAPAEDWSELEAILASTNPLCGRIGRAERLVGQGRRALLPVLVTGVCIAVFPLDRVERDCGRAGTCGAGGFGESGVLALSPPRPERAARASAPGSDTHLLEGRSSITDVRAPAATGSTVAPSSTLNSAPQRASLSIDGGSDATDAPSAAQPRTRLHRHHAWARRLHRHASR